MSSDGAALIVNYAKRGEQGRPLFSSVLFGLASGSLNGTLPGNCNLGSDLKHLP